MIHYRDLRSDDVGFVLSSWLKSAGDAWTTLRSTDAARFQGVPIGWFADVPHRFTRAAVAEILDRPTTRTVVACDPEDHGLIYGYAVAEPDTRIVHWCHVKHTLRRNGLATDMIARLLPDWRDGLTCTYLGRGFLGWSSKYPVHFNPHAGR